MSLYTRLMLLGAKAISFLLQVFGLGAGATWPGEIVLRIRSNILVEFARFKPKIIVVAGTNGKTTTSKLVETILTAAGKRVTKNASGANLENGLVSTLVSDINWKGNFLSDYYIWEVDEAVFASVVAKVRPQIIVLLNLFRDQLDRYGEVDSIAGKWSESLEKLGDQKMLKQVQHDKLPVLVINGDDPQLAYLGSLYKGEVKYFGINNPDLFLDKMQHATDSIYCPKCGKRLTFGGVYFSHLGKYACGLCGFTHPRMTVTSKDINSPLPGVYNLYNVMAATLIGKILTIEEKQINEAIADFKPAFGRSEKLTISGKNVKILLSKNPTGFNESLRTAIGEGGRAFLFVLNDRIADGTDVSWIWDVDFEMIRERNARIWVSGDRAYDLAVRLKYAGIEEKNVIVSEDLNIAVQKSLDSAKDMLYILPTYSAMLDVRKILTGKKIL